MAALRGNNRSVGGVTLKRWRLGVLQFTHPGFRDIEPFRLAAEALTDKIIPLRNLTIAAAGVRVKGDDQLLIFTSYAEATGTSLGPSALLDRSCPAGPAGPAAWGCERPGNDPGAVSDGTGSARLEHAKTRDESSCRSQYSDRLRKVARPGRAA